VGSRPCLASKALLALAALPSSSCMWMGSLQHTTRQNSKHNSVSKHPVAKLEPPCQGNNIPQCQHEPGVFAAGAELPAGGIPQL
jgi:hypothetical protein